MKILQVVKTNRGAAWALNQAKYLKELGVEIVTVLPNDSEGNAVKTYMAGSNNTRYEFTAPTAGTYYIWCDGSINVFFVGVWY